MSVEKALFISTPKLRDKMPTNKVIAKLKVKGTPAPRNTPTSPFLATSKANKPVSSAIQDLDKSYQFILRQANRQALDALPQGAAGTASRRLEYLNRLQHANFGISTMDSTYQISDFPAEECPRFVLCGQPVNGTYSPKTIDRYLSDQRVGSYKTCAQEMYRVRHSMKSNMSRSAKSIGRDSEGSKSAKSESRDDRASNVSSSYITVPSTSSSDRLSFMKRSEKGRSMIELRGRNFKSVNGLSQGWSNYASSDFMTSTRASSFNLKGGQPVVTDYEISDRKLGSCLKVNNNNQSLSYEDPNGTKTPKYLKSFIKRGIRNFNNPYRLLKHREKSVQIRSQNLDMKTVEKITNMNKDGKSSDQAVLRLPQAGAADTVVLHLMMESNSPAGRKSSASGKYSDIALHRDLDEYMVVRSSSSHSKATSRRVKSERSNLDELDEENAMVESGRTVKGQRNSK